MTFFLSNEPQHVRLFSGPKNLVWVWSRVQYYPCLLGADLGADLVAEPLQPHVVGTGCIFGTVHCMNVSAVCARLFWVCFLCCAEQSVGLLLFAARLRAVNYA